MSKEYVVFKTDLPGEIFGGELPKGIQILPNTMSRTGLNRAVSAGNVVHMLTLGEDGLFHDECMRPKEEDAE